MIMRIREVTSRSNSKRKTPQISLDHHYDRYIKELFISWVVWANRVCSVPEYASSKYEPDLPLFEGIQILDAYIRKAQNIMVFRRIASSANRACPDPPYHDQTSRYCSGADSRCIKLRHVKLSKVTSQAQPLMHPKIARRSSDPPRNNIR